MVSMVRLDVKESTRQMYGFDVESSDAFDIFYDGILFIARGDLIKAIDSLNRAIGMMPMNPYPYQFRVLVGKDKGESPDKLLPICEKWLDAAKTSQNVTQIQRAQFSYDFYKGTDAYRKETLDKYKDLFKKSLIKPERSNA